MLIPRQPVGIKIMNKIRITNYTNYWNRVVEPAAEKMKSVKQPRLTWSATNWVQLIITLFDIVKPLECLLPRIPVLYYASQTIYWITSTKVFTFINLYISLLGKRLSNLLRLTWAPTNIILKCGVVFIKYCLLECT